MSSRSSSVSLIVARLTEATDSIDAKCPECPKGEKRPADVIGAR